MLAVDAHKLIKITAKIRRNLINCTLEGPAIPSSTLKTAKCYPFSTIFFPSNETGKRRHWVLA